MLLVPAAPMAMPPMPAIMFIWPLASWSKLGQCGNCFGTAVAFIGGADAVAVPDARVIDVVERAVLIELT
jgi:hypothetical protein